MTQPTSYESLDSFPAKSHEQALDRITMMVQDLDRSSQQGVKISEVQDPLQSLVPEANAVNQGDVIFFPSFNRHRVTPVTQGKRYSLVTWFTGPAFR